MEKTKKEKALEEFIYFIMYGKKGDNNDKNKQTSN